MVDSRIHPFKQWLLNKERTQEWAAAALGVSKVYLSLILKRRRTPSRELYRDMVRLTRNGVTMRELEVFQRPSDRPRRREPKPRIAGKRRMRKVDPDAPTRLPEDPDKLH